MSEQDQFTKELKQICRDVEIENSTRFRFRTSDVIEVQNEREADWTTMKFNLLPTASSLEEQVELERSLQSVLYEKAYMRSFPVEVYPRPEELENGKLTSLFLQANDNKDGWDPGWQVYQTGDDGRLFVQKGDRSRVVIAGEYSTYLWSGVSPKNGDLLSVRKFSGTAEVQPSFYFAFGSTLSDQFDEFSLLRFYFHVRAHFAVTLMANLTAKLNRYAVPFRFKSLVNAESYTRADAAVLYVAKRYYQIVASNVFEILEQFQDGLRDATPMFTRKFAPGVAIAENPITGGSFGVHRCGLVAQGIVNAWKCGSQDVDMRMEMISQSFANVGLNIEKPYLNPKSIDIFEQPIFIKENLW